MKSDIRLFKPYPVKKTTDVNLDDLKTTKILTNDRVKKKDIPIGYYHGYGYYNTNDQCSIM